MDVVDVAQAREILALTNSASSKRQLFLEKSFLLRMFMKVSSKIP